MGFSAVVFLCLEYLWHSIHFQQEFELFFFFFNEAVLPSNGSTQVLIVKNLEVAMALSRYARYSPGRTEKRTELPKSSLSVPITRIQIKATNHGLPKMIPKCSVDNVAFY